MNAVSWERLVPFEIAVYAACVSAGDGRRPPSDILHEDVPNRTIHMVASHSPYLEGVQRVPLVLHNHCLQVCLEVRGHLRWCQRQVPFIFLFLGRSRTKTRSPPREPLHERCGCWYSITSATAQISRQSVFLVTATATGGFPRCFLKEEIEKVRISPRHLHQLCRDRYPQLETALHRVRMGRKSSLRPRPSRSVLPLSARWPRVIACLIDFQNCPTTTSGGPCSTDTLCRCCSCCALSRHPMTSWFYWVSPLFNGSQSLCWLSCSTMAHPNFDTCPLPNDAAAYRSYTLFSRSTLLATVSPDSGTRNGVHQFGAVPVRL